MATWVKEAMGMLKFGLRARLNPRWLGPEFRWAWRGVRGRGWTAAFSIGLLAVALAANAIVFSVADSLVFHSTPYPEADRLIAFDNAASPGAFGMRPADFKRLQTRAGFVRNLTGYSNSTVFLTGQGAPERVSTVTATPEMFSALGVLPHWGRVFTTADLMAPDSDSAVISEDLAIARFGSPSAAVGSVLSTTEVPLRVVGVMPSAFRFPSGTVKIWRGFTPESPLAAGIFSISAIARLQDGRDLTSTARMFAESYAGETPAAGQRPFVPVPQTYDRQRFDATRLWALLGAAACLLLTACANIASVELAAALGRTRAYAIQRSLGASRWLLARGALWEGALIVGTAALIGIALASAGVEVLGTTLPNTYSTIPANPIDLDGRVIAYMITITSLVWIATSLPVILFASGANVGEVLKSSTQSQAGSRRAALGRRGLTVVQVALAVLLLVGGTLYTRTYLARINVDKGFDSTNLASITLTVPPQMMGQRRAATDLLLERLTAHPGVLAVMPDGPPQGSDSPFGLDRIEIDGAWQTTPHLLVAQKAVSAKYHEVLRVPLREGRYFTQTEPPNQVIVNAPFADKFWPGGALGHSFRRLPEDASFTIVGVAGHVRTADDREAGSSERGLLFYTPRQASSTPPQTAQPPRPGGRRVGGPTAAFIFLTVRLDSPRRLADVLSIVRSEVPQFAVRTSMVADDYAEWEAETLLQTQVITAFGILAFLMAVAGVYGVMAFLVASRTRELGVRMALGASQRDVVALVLGSATRLVAVGTIVGLAGALAASRYVESELFGVSPSDPVTYALVALAVIAGAILATWQPTRRAARVDPATTLRAE
jgi:predicted permease